jgi:hypothetical protein
VSLKTLFDDAKADFENLTGWARSYAEEKLPALEAEVSRIEADPFVREYLGSDLAVPEHLVAIGLDFLGKLVTAWSASDKTAVTAADAAETPAAA